MAIMLLPCVMLDIAGRIRMNKKIFRTIVKAVTIVLIICLVCITGILYLYFDEIQNNTMIEEMNILQTAVENEGKDYFDTLVDDGQLRLTWIDKDGNVICDTELSNLENHANRQEFKEALETGEGFGSRYSQSLMEKSIYYARKLNDGTVLRIAKNQKTVTNLLLGLTFPALLLFCLAVILAYVIAKKSARQIVEPLNNLNLDNPLDNNTYEEINPLLNRINIQHQQIDKQVSLLEEKNAQFSQITDNLKECLILLTNEDIVINLNTAACKLFNVTKDCINKDFVYISRDYHLTNALLQAKNNGHAETEMQIEGLYYQFDITRIDFDNKTIGSVILAFDITQRKTAEQSRREFSANVSHELKTPLQGIIGSADLIQNGLVKQEDMNRFIGHIREEAERMVNLINDIIRLSQLDEAEDKLPEETFDVADLANQCVQQLSLIAADKNVIIKQITEKTEILSVKQLYREIIYNLLDNAIKYNKENGEIILSIKKDKDNCLISVKDTGIGIAKEDQEKIFERFYRVDKSHSKATGGTGLGLSIVKHAVMYFNGKIEVDSELNKGTEIRIILPQKNPQ